MKGNGFGEGVHLRPPRTLNKHANVTEDAGGWNKKFLVSTGQSGGTF